MLRCPENFYIGVSLTEYISKTGIALYVCYCSYEGSPRIAFDFDIDAAPPLCRLSPATCYVRVALDGLAVVM